MDVVDIVLVVVVVAAAIHGLRLGALVQLLTFGGFFLGFLLGALLSIAIVGSSHSQSLRNLVSLCLVFGLALLLGAGGRVLGSWSNAALRRHHLAPLDSAAGVGVAVVAVLLSAWLVASVISGSRYTWLDSAVQRSDILRTVDDVMPPVPPVFDHVQSFLTGAGFPLVFSGIAPEMAGPVSVPSTGLARTIALAAASSTVKVIGNACGYQQEGSGFVVAPGLVVTNAHVVAGEPATNVIVGGSSYPARVTYYDPQFDMALLHTSAPLGPPLSLAPTDVGRGTQGVVMGYPEDHGLTVGPAGVASAQLAEGPDIYGNGEVVREIYQVDAEVLPGNSGGPLVASDGSVIGMVFSRSTVDAGVGYALTSPAILQRLDRHQQQLASVGTGACTQD